MRDGFPLLSLADVIEFFHRLTMPSGSPMSKGKVWGHSVPENRRLTWLCAGDCE
jgi:hypothetical protein